MTNTPRRRRRYISPLRTRRSQLLRERVIACAAAEFVEHGFDGSRIRSIAAAAECSVETVYGIGTKPELLRGIVSEAIPRAVPPLGQSPELMTTLDAGDTAAAIDLLLDLAARWTWHSARLWEAACFAASADPAIDTLVQSTIAARRAACTLVAERLGGSEPADDLAASIYVLTSAETYLQLTEDPLGMTDEHYRTWVEAGLRRVLGIG